MCSDSHALTQLYYTTTTVTSMSTTTTATMTTITATNLVLRVGVLYCASIDKEGHVLAPRNIPGKVQSSCAQASCHTIARALLPHLSLFVSVSLRTTPRTLEHLIVHQVVPAPSSFVPRCPNNLLARRENARHAKCAPDITFVACVRDCCCAVAGERSHHLCLFAPMLLCTSRSWFSQKFHKIQNAAKKI